MQLVTGIKKIPDSNTTNIAFINLVLIKLLTIIESIIVAEPGRVKAVLDELNAPFPAQTVVIYSHPGRPRIILSQSG